MIIFERDVNGQSDLLAVAEDGTKTVTLANTAADEYFVASSPDGRILFTRESSLHSVRSDGSDLATLDDSGDFAKVADLPDGTAIVVNGRLIIERFALTGTEYQLDIASVFPDGSGFTPLATTDAEETFFDVTSSGRVIYRHIEPGRNEADLYAVDIDGSNVTPLAATSRNELYAGTYGDRVVVQVEVAPGQRDIYSISENGTQPNAIVATPDDERFVTVTPTGQLIFTKNDDLYTVGIDGKGLTLLAGGSTRETFQELTSAGAVIFSRSALLDQNLDLYIVNADGTNEVPLAATPDYEAFYTVTPTGRAIYYGSPIVSGASGFYDIYSVDPTGQNLARLTDTPDQDERVIVLTASGQVVFARVGNGVAGLHIASADGTGSSKQLIDGGGVDVFRVTNNDRLLYTREVGDDVELWSMRLDGSDAQLIAEGVDYQQFVGIVRQP